MSARELTPTAEMILGLLRLRPRSGLRHQAGDGELDALLLGCELRPDLPGAAAARGGRARRGRATSRAAACADASTSSRTRARVCSTRGSAPTRPDRFELRDEGLLRLFFGEALDAEALLALVRRRRAWYELSAAEFRQIEEHFGGLGDNVYGAVLDYGIELMEWNAAWFAALEARLSSGRGARSPRRPPPGSGGSGPPLSAAAISPQSGWCPTATTVPSAPSSASSRPAAVAPGARRSSTRSCASARARDRVGGLARPQERAREHDCAAARRRGARRAPVLARGRPRVRLRSSSGLPGAALAWRTRKSRTRGSIGAPRARSAAGVWAGSLAPVTSYRYVVADVFTDTPLAGNQLAVFTDAREPRRGDPPVARPRDRLLRDGVRPAARGRRPRTPPDLHARDRAAVRRAPAARHGVRARGADAAGADPARDGQRGRAGRADPRRVGPDRVRPHEPAGPDLAAARGRRRAAGRRRGRAVGAARRAVRQRRGAHVRGAPEQGGGRRPASRTGARSSASGSTASTASRGRGHELEDAHVRAFDGVGEDAATGSAAGPLAVHLAGTAGLPSATRSRSSRARRSRARRGSTRGSRARRTASTASRSAAPP